MTETRKHCGVKKARPKENTYSLNPSMFHYIIGSKTDKTNLMLGVWI